VIPRGSSVPSSHRMNCAALLHQSKRQAEAVTECFVAVMLPGTTCYLPLRMETACVLGAY
jgi:hypothetical protein